MVFARADLAVMAPDFALTRLLAKSFRRESASLRANWIEANVVGWSLFVVSDLFFANRLFARLPAWLFLPAAVAAILPTCLFWIALLLLNSRLTSASRRAQSIFVLIVATLFALDLARQNNWLSVFGFVWLAGISLNAIARLILLFRDGKK